MPINITGCNASWLRIYKNCCVGKYRNFRKSKMKVLCFAVGVNLKEFHGEVTWNQLKCLCWNSRSQLPTGQDTEGHVYCTCSRDVDFIYKKQADYPCKDLFRILKGKKLF